MLSLNLKAGHWYMRRDGIPCFLHDCGKTVTWDAAGETGVWRSPVDMYGDDGIRSDRAGTPNSDLLYECTREGHEIRR